MLKLVRRIGEFLLLAALFMPLGTCSGTFFQEPPVQPEGTVKTHISTPAPSPTPKVLYVYEFFGEVDSWILPLAFVWPLVFAVLYYVSRWKALTGLLRVLEIPLLWWSGYFLYVVWAAYDLKFGWFVALIGLCLVATQSIIRAFTTICQFVRYLLSNFRSEVGEH
jgi:hypothetical protein